MGNKLPLVPWKNISDTKETYSNYNLLSISSSHRALIFCKQNPQCLWYQWLYHWVFHVWMPGLHYILVWYSRSVHPDIWHTLYGVNACENHDPGKWQAMHDANACENYIAIILWRQSPYFMGMWNHLDVLRHSRLVIVDCILYRHYRKLHKSEWCKCLWKPHCYLRSKCVWNHQM